ncbi:MAG: hypothetical protein M1834_007503 [Cirrosporium novae-zelandiae]|nr:MAG: hypothetical protein M1834_007503 [Cirrosporium novae-zelandiae]
MGYLSDKAKEIYSDEKKPHRDTGKARDEVDESLHSDHGVDATGASSSGANNPEGLQNLVLPRPQRVNWGRIIDDDQAAGPSQPRFASRDAVLTPPPELPDVLQIADRKETNYVSLFGGGESKEKEDSGNEQAYKADVVGSNYFQPSNRSYSPKEGKKPIKRVSEDLQDEQKPNNIEKTIADWFRPRVPVDYPEEAFQRVEEELNSSSDCSSTWEAESDGNSDGDSTSSQPGMPSFFQRQMTVPDQGQSKNDQHLRVKRRRLNRPDATSSTEPYHSFRKTSTKEPSPREEELLFDEDLFRSIEFHVSGTSTVHETLPSEQMTSEQNHHSQTISPQRPSNLQLSAAGEKNTTFSLSSRDTARSPSPSRVSSTLNDPEHLETLQTDISIPEITEDFLQGGDPLGNFIWQPAIVGPETRPGELGYENMNDLIMTLRDILPDCLANRLESAGIFKRVLEILKDKLGHGPKGFVHYHSYYPIPWAVFEKAIKKKLKVTTINAVADLACGFPIMQDDNDRGNIRPLPDYWYPYIYRIAITLAQVSDAIPHAFVYGWTEYREWTSTWPAGAVPLELFHTIGKYLTIQEIKRLRLVNREFDSKISPLLFRSVVLPFRPETYDIYKDHGNGNSKPVDHSRDLLRSFQTWGSHIRNFGMSFDLHDATLSSLPEKIEVHEQRDWFGSFQWPLAAYPRFSEMARKEKVADRTKLMADAFSCIDNVTSLGLTIDNGLGWLSGLDKSDRSRIFDESSKVFGRSFENEDAVYRRVLDYMIHRIRATSFSINECIFYYDAPNHTVWQLDDTKRLVKKKYFDNYHYEDRLDKNGRPVTVLFENKPNSTLEGPIEHVPLIFDGRGMESPVGWHKSNHPALTNSRREGRLEKRKVDYFSSADLIPSKLTKAQQEYLIETGWAQSAFLTSYALAILDNRRCFENVHTFTIAKIPQSYLQIFDRTDFWDALPGLSTLTICILPEWRKLPKDIWELQNQVDGVRRFDEVTPSYATRRLHHFVKDNIARLTNVKTLNLGYFGGGEHAPGMGARNKHVLPAPLSRDYPIHLLKRFPGTMLMAGDHMKNILRLPHVQNLTLQNCWISPPVLETFMGFATDTKLKMLTLDSVSLTSVEVNYKSPNATPQEFADQKWLVTQYNTGSWPDIVDRITPGPKLYDIRYGSSDTYIPLQRPRTNLERIAFKSCGYVRLDELNNADFDQSKVTPHPNALLAAQAFLQGQIQANFIPAQVDQQAQNPQAPQAMQPGQNPQHILLGANHNPFAAWGGQAANINANGHRWPQTPHHPNDFTLDWRRGILKPQMLISKDQNLGSIVTFMPEEDEKYLQFAFGMQIGWGDDPRQYENLEDGHVRGGEGRFSGEVSRFDVPPSFE